MCFMKNSLNKTCLPTAEGRKAVRQKLMKMRFFERLKDKLQTTEFIYPQRKSTYTAFFCNECHHVNLNLIVLSGFVRLDSAESAELSKSGDVICEVPRLVPGTTNLNQPNNLKGKKTKGKSINESESKGISGASNSGKSLSSTALIRIEASIRRANGEMFSFELGPPKKLCDLKKWLDISEIESTENSNATKAAAQGESQSDAASANAENPESNSESQAVSKRAEKRAVREEDKRVSPSKKIPRDRRPREKLTGIRKEASSPSTTGKEASKTQINCSVLKNIIHAKLLGKRPPYMMMGEFDPVLVESEHLPLSAVELIKV